MKRDLIGRIDLKPKLKCEQSVVVEYFRTETGEEDDKFDKSRPFGIEVIKKQTIDGVTYKEIKTINQIEDDTEKIDNLLNLLKTHSVTPITVADILEDMKVI